MGEPEVSPNPPGPMPDDSRITIILDGKTSTPKAIDFYQVNAFQMMAIGEWLLLKGKQMIAAAEDAEMHAAGIATPRLHVPSADQLLRLPK